MEPRKAPNGAAMMVALTKCRGEVSVGSMGEGPLSKLVAMKDVTTLQRREESASGMVLSLKLAAVKDALTTPRREEFVLGMGQRKNFAVMRDAPTY